MDIMDLLSGFANKNPTPIQKGDWIKHKETKIISQVLNCHGGLIYGRTSNGMLTVGTAENYEKV